MYTWALYSISGNKELREFFHHSFRLRSSVSVIGNRRPVSELEHSRDDSVPCGREIIKPREPYSDLLLCPEKPGSDTAILCILERVVGTRPFWFDR